MMFALLWCLHYYYKWFVSVIIIIFNLSDDNSYILEDIILQLDSFALFVHLSVNNRLLITCVLSLAVW